MKIFFRMCLAKASNIPRSWLFRLYRSFALHKKILVFLLVILILYTTSDATFSKKANKKPAQEKLQLNFEPYNKFPGNQEVSLHRIESKRQIISIPVISP